MPLIDYTGRRFGPRGVLLVLSRAENTNDGKTQWKCRCELHGKVVIIRGKKLRHRKGCCRQRMKHGHSRVGKISPTYSSWRAMTRRCLEPTNPKYPIYGGANPPVTVCDRWRDKTGFVNFLSDLGKRKRRTTLGRFGDTGSYEPGNCKWMTQREQVANRKKRKLLLVATLFRADRSLCNPALG